MMETTIDNAITYSDTGSIFENTEHDHEEEHVRAPCVRRVAIVSQLNCIQRHMHMVFCKFLSHDTSLFFFFLLKI